jgi:hypothetical protein
LSLTMANPRTDSCSGMDIPESAGPARAAPHRTACASRPDRGVRGSLAPRWRRSAPGELRSDESAFRKAYSASLQRLQHISWSCPDPLPMGWAHGPGVPCSHSCEHICVNTFVGAPWGAPSCKICCKKCRAPY